MLPPPPPPPLPLGEGERGRGRGRGGGEEKKNVFNFLAGSWDSVFFFDTQNWKKGGIASAWRAGGSRFAALFLEYKDFNYIYNFNFK